MRYTSEHDSPMWSAPYDRPEHSHEPDRCAKCGDEEFEMEETRIGTLCSSCTRTCCVCEDWLLTDETVFDHDGNEAHKTCAEDGGFSFAITPAQVVMLAAELSERRPA